MGKPASQSSTEIYPPYNYAAFQGNDGDRSNTFASTQTEVNPWWQVDLGGNAHILRVSVSLVLTPPVAIHVGDDNSGGGINNTPCAVVAMSYWPKLGEFVCPIGMEGRYVSVHLNRNYWLILREVEVYGVLLKAP